MTRATAIGGSILVGAMLLPVTTTGQSQPSVGHSGSPRVYLADPVARGAVKRAVLGATVRLGRPGCQRIFTDFTDDWGQRLLAAIEESTRAAAEYLVERVWFVDGDDTPQCRNHPATAAFTGIGDHVIRVCATRFAERFARQTTAAELIIIHELLHTLGLGENPPTSSDITKQVTARCGGS
jgi:hypothetical protein